MVLDSWPLESWVWCFGFGYIDNRRALLLLLAMGNAWCITKPGHGPQFSSNSSTQWLIKSQQSLPYGPVNQSRQASKQPGRWQVPLLKFIYGYMTASDKFHARPSCFLVCEHCWKDHGRRDVAWMGQGEPYLRMSRLIHNQYSPDLETTAAPHSLCTTQANYLPFCLIHIRLAIRCVISDYTHSLYLVYLLLRDQGLSWTDCNWSFVAWVRWPHSTLWADDAHHFVSPVWHWTAQEKRCWVRYFWKLSISTLTQIPHKCTGAELYLSLTQMYTASKLFHPTSTPTPTKSRHL